MRNLNGVTSLKFFKNTIKTIKFPTIPIADAQIVIQTKALMETGIGKAMEVTPLTIVSLN